MAADHGDDTGVLHERIAKDLRDAIKGGTYKPGEQLPKRHELMTTYGASKSTVQRAIRHLIDDDLVVVRQGAGSFVRRHNHHGYGLDHDLTRAFHAPHVSIDYAGATGEYFREILADPLSNIYLGRLRPESVQIRVLLPDWRYPLGIPAAFKEMADHPDLRARKRAVTDQAAQEIVEEVSKLHTTGAVEAVSVSVRRIRATPVFRLVLINHTTEYLGFYPIQRRATVNDDGTVTAVYEHNPRLLAMHHHAINTHSPSATDTQAVTAATNWFTNAWETLAQPADQTS